MSIFLNIIIVLLLSILQTSTMKHFLIFDGTINLPLIILISLILIQNKKSAFIWMFSGMALDILAPVQFGMYTFSFIAIYLIYSYVVGKFINHLSLPIVAFFALGSLAIDLPFFLSNMYYQALLLDMLYNTVFGYIIYWFIKYYFEPRSIIKVEL